MPLLEVYNKASTVFSVIKIVINNPEITKPTVFSILKLINFPKALMLYEYIFYYVKWYNYCNVNYRKHRFFIN